MLAPFRGVLSARFNARRLPGLCAFGKSVRFCVFRGGVFTVRISGIDPGSAAERAGLLPGDELLSINGSPINDGLDYYFYTADSVLDIALSRGSVRVKKDEYEPLGAEFETYLITGQKRCRNNCIFCFIDQNPKGMRESVYFKDDDERLSFLYGNYVTLTNLSDADIARIIKLRISPLNVSVHTMRRELRCRMMGNRFAGDALDRLTQLSEHGIAINAQLVLCEGINDGDELQYSMEELYRLKSLQSVSAVPVGVTAHREGLYPLKPYTREGALKVVKAIEAFADGCRAEKGVRLFYASDEFYITAGLPIPEEDEYDGYPQLENGVGMLRCHREEFLCALDAAKERFGRADFAGRTVSAATGALAYEHIKELCTAAEDAFPGLKAHVYRVENDFFGRTVTVSGLVTGGDLIAALKGAPLGEALLIPCNMLRHERDLFLDGVSVTEAEEKLGVPVLITEQGGESLLAKLLGISEEELT